MSAREHDDAAVEVPARRRMWTTVEMALLRQTYPIGGASRTHAALPHRNHHAIRQQARRDGLFAPSARPQRRPAIVHQVTPALDQAIREGYARAAGRGDLAALAQRLGRPAWWVGKRATYLGVTPPRQHPGTWSDAELRILERRACQHPQTIAQALRSAGYARSESAIVMRRKRLGCDTSDPDRWTTGDLAQCMGVERSTVARWIERGGLPAEQHGEIRKVTRRALRSWIAGHPQSIDLRKVDRYWFIDLAFGTAT